MYNKYNNLWCLRDGDLNPEPLSTILRENGYNTQFIDELRGRGLLFTSKNDAQKASEVAKRAILNMSRRHRESNHKQVRTRESSPRRVRENASHLHQYNNSSLFIIHFD